MTDREALRERVARAKYEAKRARLLEAFGDTAGWPEWDNLKQTLKEIEMEEHDLAIAVALEEAASEIDGPSAKPTEIDEWIKGYLTARRECAAAIRALIPSAADPSS